MLSKMTASIFLIFATTLASILAQDVKFLIVTEADVQSELLGRFTSGITKVQVIKRNYQLKKSL